MPPLGWSKQAPHESVLSRVDHVDGCWVFTGAKGRGGYGVITINIGPNRRTTRKAHRVLYEHVVGPIPDGLTLDHLCRNRACVNPAHLEAVTVAENIRRGQSSNAAKTHCPQGHEYTDENTYVNRGADGYVHRSCSTCQKQRAAGRRERHAA